MLFRSLKVVHLQSDTIHTILHLGVDQPEDQHLGTLAPKLFRYRFINLSRDWQPGNLTTNLIEQCQVAQLSTLNERHLILYVKRLTKMHCSADSDTTS